jgi:hypothetical protein
MAAIIAFEFGAIGQLSTGVFHGLSGGKTSKAERMASASGESNGAVDRIGIVAFLAGEPVLIDHGIV